MRSRDQEDIVIMRFTLTYSGDELRTSGSSRSGGRNPEKQALRAHFHPQLLKVWDRHFSYRQVNRTILSAPVKRHDRWEAPGPERTSLASLLFRHRIRDSSFIPLLTPNMEVHCHIALQLGRPVKFGTIFAGGDLDGRLKTLFDALAVPARDENFPDHAPEGEYLCLLSDDDLITGLSIESYELLDSVPESRVDITLHITITAITPMPATSVLIFGG